MGTTWRAFLQGSAAALLLLSLVVTPSGGVQAQTRTFDSILILEIESSNLDAISVGDVTGDGRNDIVATSRYGGVSELLVIPQTENGDYLETISYPLNAWARSSVLGDLDGDGVDDIVLGTDDGVEVFRQFSGQLYPIGSDTYDRNTIVGLGDIDSDGDLDIVSARRFDKTVTQLFNDGTGMFPDEAPLDGWGYGYEDLVVADVNSDGRNDVVGLTAQSQVGVWAQTIDGLAQPTIIGYGWGEVSDNLAVGDVTGDGANDAVVSLGRGVPNGLGVLAQDPTNGVLSSPTFYPSYNNPAEVEVADFNNDSRLDVVVAHSGWGAVGAYLQQPDGGLGVQDLYDLPSSNSYETMASGDLAGNALPDVVVANSDLTILYSTDIVGGPGCAPAETQYGRAAEPSSVETQSGPTTERRQLTRVEG